MFAFLGRFIPAHLVCLVLVVIQPIYCLAEDSLANSLISRSVKPGEHLLVIRQSCADVVPGVSRVPSKYLTVYPIDATPLESVSRVDLLYTTKDDQVWWVLFCNSPQPEVDFVADVLRANMLVKSAEHKEGGITLWRMKRKAGPVYEGRDTQRSKIAIELVTLFTQAGAITDLQSEREFPDVIFATRKTGDFIECLLKFGYCKTIHSFSVAKSGEIGLLGMAFHPDFSNNRRVFFHYNPESKVTCVRSQKSQEDSPGALKRKCFTSRVSELRLQKNSYKIDFSFPERIVFETDQEGSYHAGGQIRFGPDGMLYVALGEAGKVGVRDLQSLRGKILRIDVNNLPESTISAAIQGQAYGIPRDNPFVKKPAARGEIWAWGFRNPWRFTFDPSGRLWVADVGENHIEEISIVDAGKDYGWNIREGVRCNSTADECAQLTGAIEPVIHYDRREGNAVIGGELYEAKDYPALFGKYIFGDGVTGRLWAVDSRPQKTKSLNAKVVSLGRWPMFITTFGKNVEGQVLVASLSGDIYRITRPK